MSVPRVMIGGCGAGTGTTGIVDCCNEICVDNTADWADPAGS